MNKIIFDASALLALLNQETGYELISEYLSKIVMSSVNFSEVFYVLTDLGMSENQTKTLLLEVVKEIIPFDVEQAFILASLRKITKPYGLSFADRACLALAKKTKLPILTVDKAWEKIDHGIKIILAR